MTCRTCIHHDACGDIVNQFLKEQYPNWEREWYVVCDEFDGFPIESKEPLTNNSEDTAATYSTMDEVGAQLINLYAEYSRMVGYTDDDYAKAVCIAVRMLSD